MRCRWIGVGLAALMILAAAAPAGAQEPIRIGVLAPLTGPSAASGQEIRQGALLAAEELNASGGVLGRTIELIIEDTKGDPPTGVAALEKLMSRDRVQIVAGGLSSTVAYALAGPARRYQPVMVYIGAASRTVEEAFRDADWFFHIHPWEYHNLQATTDFMVSTGAKTVGIAYEDGLFGVGGRDLAAELFTAAGLNVVFDESFRSGSADFTPLLTRARQVNPDIFYWIGYAADALPLMTQMREVNFSPKLVYGAPPSWPEGFGQLAESQYVAGLTFWTADIPTPESRAFVEAYTQRWGRAPLSYWAPLSYTNIITIAQAIERAGSTEKPALIRALEQTDYATPVGQRLTFKPSRIIRHQGFTNWVSFQWIDGKQEIVYPSELATHDLVYPAPAWAGR